MSQPHMHLGGPHMTQNQGNVLGDRPCVRQSRLYREQVGGNAMKDIMGQTSLKWDTNRTQGAYEGGRVYDHNSQRYEHEPQPLASKEVNHGVPSMQAPIKVDAVETAGVHRRGAGAANRTTYNFMTGQ
mmetsp:Transcript_75369/g.87588  ORF Transcript_75369/g.87588 Transcript_75369/m.87588 type:complete len:128 (+) Transcript_75369:46-429(+)|eukprot:CAMPEP_0176434734 /NCGR_PEP_ID=MMETSP0127-20121128/16863_1 /TAXON_ID=938130 /ORGANISM="Platyophrya macrostoma, Strain WH" /LENGTH=127 /DNA_ID=CAMNT_0017817547 /DNA_START=46 /DNA_END=429 /DNA_ORIENTATION=+